LNPIELVSAGPWRQAVFTTYALSLAFFEAVILDRLVRGGARQATIFADPEGIRAALQEQGARGTGRDYELEALACTTGAFHAKVSSFVSDDDCHLLVGSGNLTFGGWGGNLELFVHLHPSFAADAFHDAANFFEYLSIADSVRMRRSDGLEPLVAALRRAAANGKQNGNVRMLNSLEGPIADQIGAIADELGGARRLTLASPFFDLKGIGINWLTTRLGLDTCHVHVHDEVVHGQAGLRWPFEADVEAVVIEELLGGDLRRLHAKCFEIMCRKGRLIVAGSANATQAALVKGNIETVVVRIQRNRLTGWSLVATDPPVDEEPLVDNLDDTKLKAAVLTATLEGETLQGTILSSFPTGEGLVSIRTTAGSILLGPALVDASGSFTVSAKSLESAAWSSGPITAVVVNGQATAEGFVSFGEALEIVRRGGAMAPRIFAMLLGTETPEDAAAVLSWFAQSPHLLLATHGANAPARPDGESQPVPVTSDMLHATALAAWPSPGDRMVGNNRAWERAMSALMAAFGTARRSWGDLLEDDPDEPEQTADKARHRDHLRREKAKEKVVVSFEELLEGLLDSQPLIALSLAVYVASRVAPPAVKARHWFNRIASLFERSQIRGDALLSGIKMLLIATDGNAHAAPRAREYLIEQGLDPLTYEVETNPLIGLTEIFQEDWDAPSFIETVRRERSSAEEVASLIASAGFGSAEQPYIILKESPHWSRLKSILEGHTSVDKLVIVDHVPDACPRCHLMFTPIARDELRLSGVTDHCRLVVRTVRK